MQKIQNKLPFLVDHTTFYFYKQYRRQSSFFLDTVQNVFCVLTFEKIGEIVSWQQIVSISTMQEIQMSLFVDHAFSTLLPNGDVGQPFSWTQSKIFYAS